ncbi:MAG: efflux RND transporter periplasmic adaptor subunit [Anaerolineae bacterium]|nr:efflux RND transporter periplasmic adaptor subunit [Anaerolineae bacterium]
MRHRLPIVLAVVAVLLLVPAVAGASAGPVQTVLSTVHAAVAEATAVIIPSRVADISFAVPGQVAHVTVAEGDIVEAGQLLMTLDTAALEADIARTEAVLAATQAQFDLLKAMPGPADVAVAEAQLAVAEAALAQAIAQRSLITPEIQQAALAALEAGLANAKALEQAARIYEIQQREKSLEDWQKEVNLLRLRAAELALEAAEASLAQLPQDQRTILAQYNTLIMERQAHRDHAEALLNGLRAGAGAEELAIAEARVDQAAVALQNAKLRLTGTSLYAPFAGTVAALAVNVGQAVMPGQPLLTLADVATLQVETTDLSERDVTELDVGMGATIYVEALNLELPGHVTGISFRPTIVAGDVTYPVRVTLDETPPGLRWGMTAEVAFEGGE